MGQMMMKEPSTGTDRGPKCKKVRKKEPASTTELQVKMETRLTGEKGLPIGEIRGWDASTLQMSLQDLAELGVRQCCPSEHADDRDRDDDCSLQFQKEEGDLHRLRIQDIEDMLLLLVQGKVTNLSVEERIAFNVSLRMFTRRVVIQRRVEDLQLGVESYQKKLNLTKPDTYRSNLRRQDAYTPYSDPRGFIYENKDKKNRLMRIDELHKFSDGTLDDVRTVLNDRLKGIRMEYLPETFWSQRDKANARAMIQAIDKRLKTRRIMRSLEKFVGGRPYGDDYVRSALNDRLKGIRMEYLPETFWNHRDKANARAMIQAIDKRLKTRRIMRSLERFVGGRPYGGDLRLLQRTI
ncbi:hypothetical protein Tco_0405003 [Tanacetum coccineum]